MSDRKALSDSNETPEDVATLYSWANLHGAKYRDFSASRAQTREKARQRVQEALEAERRRAQQEAEAQKMAEMQRAAEIQRLAEQQVRERAEQEAAERAAQLQREAQLRAAAPAPPRYAPPAAPYTPAPSPYSSPAQAYQPPAYPPAVPYQAPQPAAPQYAPAPPQYAQPGPTQYPAYSQPSIPAAREQTLRPGRGWSPAEQRENAARPAWLAERSDLPAAPVQHAPEDTLQGSRDRITSRWFALQGLFAPGASATQEPAPAPPAARAPVLAVFSLAGGVGKTSLVATLGRALSARGERVLLVDTAIFGLLPFFYGARDQRAGVLRTFTAPGNSGDAPVQLLTVDCENLGPDAPGQEALSQEIGRHGHGASRILVDLATASGAVTRRVLRMNPTILIPVIADMGSVVSVSSIEAFFQRSVGPSGHPVMPFYVMNQFDASLPLHLDVREVLREQLGDRLLPFSLRRTPAVSEALAEGMTVVDYAPNSMVAEDFGALAGWVKSLAAPATGGFRGVRWSER